MARWIASRRAARPVLAVGLLLGTLTACAEGRAPARDMRDDAEEARADDEGADDGGTASRDARAAADAANAPQRERDEDDDDAAPHGDASSARKDADVASDTGKPDAAEPDQPVDADGATASPGPDCRGGTEPDFSLVGWATEQGGTSGGKGGTVLTVRDGAALVQALKDKRDQTTPLTILVSGTVTAESAGVEKIDVKDVRDVSIIGAGSGATFDGIGIKIVRAGNIVVRNLKIANVQSGDKDAISIEGPVDHVWVDHCELHAELEGVGKDDYDGLLDAKGEAAYLTYSWNYLHDSWKTSLVGSSESDVFDRKLTMHHNHFEHCNSRTPLFRGGNGHVFNNYYDRILDTGVNARIGACVRLENNYFRDAKNPWVSAFSDELGAVELVCNMTVETSFMHSDDVREPLGCEAVVPYDYEQVLTAVSEVPGLVATHAGVGKLRDPTAF